MILKSAGFPGKAPRNTAENTVHHCRGGVDLVIDNLPRWRWNFSEHNIKFKTAHTFHTAKDYHAHLPHWLTKALLYNGVVVRKYAFTFAVAPLGPVHFLLPDRQSGIHCLIICGIRLSTPNNLGGTWRCICLLDIHSISVLEVVIALYKSTFNYLLTYLLPINHCLNKQSRKSKGDACGFYNSYNDKHDFHDLTSWERRWLTFAPAPIILMSKYYRS